MGWLIEFPCADYYAENEDEVKSIMLSYVRKALRAGHFDKTKPEPPDLGPDDLALLRDCPTRRRLMKKWENYLIDFNVWACQNASKRMARLAVRLGDVDMANQALRDAMIICKRTMLQRKTPVKQKRVRCGALSDKVQKAFLEYCVRHRLVALYGVAYGLMIGGKKVPVVKAKRGNRKLLFKAIEDGGRIMFVPIR